MFGPYRGQGGGGAGGTRTLVQVGGRTKISTNTTSPIERPLCLTGEGAAGAADANLGVVQYRCCCCFLLTLYFRSGSVVPEQDLIGVLVIGPIRF